jgi:hypothetical protein
MTTWIPVTLAILASLGAIADIRRIRHRDGMERAGIHTWNGHPLFRDHEA